MLLAALLLSLALLAAPTRAHNWLTNPHAFNRRFNTGSCRGPQCTNACPDILLPSQMKNTVYRPAATWRRGQPVRITWARNSHHGGFFRLALVPVPSMNDRAVHRRLTLLHGCFESGEYDCRAAGDSCGTDQRGRAFQRWVTVPTCFPDGNYVVGYVWYGGLKYTREVGQFGDFYSCSFVRIAGGAALGGAHKATWSPGWHWRVKYGKCQTSAADIGECRSGCRSRRSFYGLPKAFWGAGPAPFGVGDVRAAFNSQSGSRNEVTGLCKANVCCPKQCGTCGGPVCNRLPGGGNRCCIGAIQRSRRPCSKFAPPCIRF